MNLSESLGHVSNNMNTLGRDGTEFQSLPTCASLRAAACLRASETLAVALEGTQASATSTLRVKSRFILLRVW